MLVKAITSLEKCFPDEYPVSKHGLSSFSMLKNERYSFQVCFRVSEVITSSAHATVTVDSPLADCVSLYRVRCTPAELPIFVGHNDGNYLRTEPGLFPDVLEPFENGGHVSVSNVLHSVWIEIDPKGSFPASAYPVTVTVKTDAEEASVTCLCEIIDAELPPQELIFTQWFYVDCLMNYYRTGFYDERLWTVIENFMNNAARYGQNMILTPVLSPSLDTAVGTYRRNVQLADVKVDGGAYSFDFSKLGRWVDLCDKAGIKYLEINHFFTQWGAAACPQVWATVDGEYKRIFGWDTHSDSPEYKNFLSQLIPAFLAYLRNEKNGSDKRCRFHISDEPSLEQLDKYRELSDMVRPFTEGLPIMDALSNYEFYKLGLVDCPVPATDHAAAFIENEVPDLWLYYCCGQMRGVSNRFLAMPSSRNRIIGTQFYKYNIAGFLQWGYNFYNTMLSLTEINPFNESDAGGFVPAGDPFSVYPGPDLKAWPSLREVVFFDAIQDLRALKLLESMIGREKVLHEVENGIPGITLSSYPSEIGFIPSMRERINALIKKHTRIINL